MQFYQQKISVSNIPIITPSMQNFASSPGLWKINTIILDSPDYIEIIEDIWRNWKNNKNIFKTKHERWDMTKYNIKLLSIEFCTMKNRQSDDIWYLEVKLHSIQQKNQTEVSM